MNEETIQGFIEELLENCSPQTQIETFRVFIEELAESTEGEENEPFFLALAENVLELAKEFEYKNI